MTFLPDRIDSAKRMAFWSSPRDLFLLRRLISRKKKELASCKAYEDKLVICAELESLCELEIMAGMSAWSPQGLDAGHNVRTEIP